MQNLLKLIHNVLDEFQSLSMTRAENIGNLRDIMVVVDILFREYWAGIMLAPKIIFTLSLMR